MNLIEKILEITDKPSKNIIKNQQDIKLGQFRKEELDIVLKKTKGEKLKTWTKYLLK